MKLQVRRTRAAHLMGRWAGTAFAVLACGTAVHAEDSTTVFRGGQVFTANAAAPYAEALAIRGDRIIAVGALPAVTAIAGSSARIVDLQGRFLMPGMLDAHAHPIDGGETLVQAHFEDTSDSIPALVAFVADQVAKKTSLRGDVLVIYGLDIGYWAKAAEVDAQLSTAAYAKLPIVLFGSDGHTAWGNHAARMRAHIAPAFLRQLKSADRIYYGFNTAYQPNGFVVDAGTTKLSSILPPQTPQAMLAAGEAAVHYMNAQGITGWLDAAVSGTVGGTIPASPDDPGYLPVYRALAERHELTAHVSAYPVIRPVLGMQQIDAVAALRAKYRDVPNLDMPGLKIFEDGVVEIPSQTAALTQPYKNTGRSTPPLVDPALLKALVTEADHRGMIVHIHAIGDLAVKQSLDAFAAARAANPAGTLPHTLTHAQFVDPEDIPRFGELHVIAALQLLWAIADQSTNEQVKPYIDPGIYQWMYPARSMLDTGAIIAGASDWPVTSANPFEAIYQAETRVGPQGVLNAAERMPRIAMLYAYTINSAHVLNKADQIGSLEPGKLADLALIDRDVLTVPADQMKDAKVIWTMLGGKIVYGKSEPDKGQSQ